MNPGGSSKDRVARQIILEAERSGQLQPGGTLVEGTAGSTGISLALLARKCGYNCEIIMPDDMATEKSDLLVQLGATVHRVPAVSIVNNGHFCKRAQQRASEISGGFYCDQFEYEFITLLPFLHDTLYCISIEGLHNIHFVVNNCVAALTWLAAHVRNLANYSAHFSTTGPEVWAQTEGKVDAFVMAAGTGGTLGGVGGYLRLQNPGIVVALVDPPGSALYNKVAAGVLYAPQQAEKKLRRNRYDTITEGIGIDRLTANFAKGLADITMAFQGTDLEAVEMGHWLLRNEGLFVGSSSAMNCVGAVKLARKLGPGKTIVTVLCDSGARSLSKMYNPSFLAAKGLKPSGRADGLDFVA